MSNGQFIVFDGIDGGGKSTQIECLANDLRRRGKTVYVTREPGGTPFAETLRDLVLHHATHNTSDLLAMFAARADHIEQVLKPRVAAGEWVICSRFSDATLAYQGYGANGDLAKIKTLISWVQGDFQPYVRFILDLPVAAARARRAGRAHTDKFEAEADTFMERVRQGYLQIAKESPADYAVIDAMQPVSEITAQVIARLSAVL